MQGLKVGHYTNADKGTGITVFLFEKEAVGAYWISGSAPATHELAVLDAENSVEKFHALSLSGGSAYGLYSAKGVMTYLTERGIGLTTPHGIVPIVPAAAMYDLSYKSSLPPTEEEAYSACMTAREDNTESGRLGAGTGATVGKLIPKMKSMSGGLGRAELTLPNGVAVIAYAVVNSVGDVRDTSGKIVAGACDASGQFANCEAYLLSGQGEIDLFSHTNTTLVAVITNAKFTKGELKRIAKMAGAGLCRAIFPVSTRYDGDLIFCVSVGELHASDLTIGTVAAEAVRLAILNAVKDPVIL